MCASRPRVLITIPDGVLKAHMFGRDFREKIASFADVEWNELGRELTEQEFALAIRGKDACITGWGSPRLSSLVLKNADRLRFVGHCAGTVRWLVDEDFFSRGIVLTNANLALARSVGEYCLMTLLMARWNICRTLANMRSGGWQGNNDVVDGINGCRIGLFGYGATAQIFIDLLKPFDVKVLVCSSHCSPEVAARGGFALSSEEEVLACDVISLHMTLSEATRGFMNRERLSRLRDGAILMNTARGAVVDEDALIDELKTGRIAAVLDVFREEPLPSGSVLRSLPNVIATPHCAGTSVYWRRKMAELILSDMEIALSGGVPKGLITLEKYRSMTPA